MVDLMRMTRVRVSASAGGLLERQIQLVGKIQGVFFVEVEPAVFFENGESFIGVKDLDRNFFKFVDHRSIVRCMGVTDFQKHKRLGTLTNYRLKRNYHLIFPKLNGYFEVSPLIHHYQIILRS